MGAVSIALFFFVQSSIRNVVKACGCLGSKQTLSSISWCCLRNNKDHEVNSWHRSGRISPDSFKFFYMLGTWTDLPDEAPGAVSRDPRGTAIVSDAFC